MAVYRYHWKETPAGDARQVRPDDIPDFDILCAGFPCQSFSVSGKREGFRDPRGTLFYEICRIARVKRPRLLLLENVEGLLSVDRGETFGTMLQELGDLGYGVEWQVLNSKGFGVPQNRPRVFIVGHLGGIRGREVFPIEEGDGVPSKNDKRRQGIASCLVADYHRGARKQRTFVIRRQNKREGAVVDNTAPSLRASGGTDIRKRPLLLSKVGNQQKYELHEGECTTLRGMARHNNVPMVLGQTNPHSAAEERRFRLSETARSIKAEWSSQQQPLAVIDTQIRRFTPRECERFQGFPDDWTRWGIGEDGKKVEISDTQRYRMMGNAVTVNVVEFIAGRLPA